MTAIESFRVEVAQRQLDDLARRLDAMRWPDRETVPDWSQGIPLNFVREVCTYWRDRYDWRRCEAALNAWPHFTTRIDDLSVHFLHVRSRHENALPLLLTHGWPGSFVEFAKCIAPLTNPTAHGGLAEDAFHLIIPSLPGVGFSGHPTVTGWSPDRVARAWTELMARLGYGHWIAQGGDWGAMVTDTIGALAPAGCLGIHLNMAIVFPLDSDLADLTPYEAASLKTRNDYMANGSGYFQLQNTRPQTLAYALSDSPVGQAAWILEKMVEWSDGSEGLALSFDDMLDNIMLYWLNGCAGSSARLYWDTARRVRSHTEVVDVPTGITIFPKEIIRPSRRWAERRFRNIQYWNEVDRGGHFAAFEEPDLFVQELRRFGRLLR